MPSSPHNPDSCYLCEHPQSQAFRRLWKHEPKSGYWHTIADGPDLMARLPRQAHFITVLAYRPDADGSPAQYRGPLYAEWDATDPAAVLDEVRTCLQALQVEYDLPLDALRLWHSGGRGYHLTIPPVVFGAEAGHPQLPRIYGAMLDQLLPTRIAPSLDRAVYSSGKGRMWRLPNRKRSGTGRFKVPLSVREVLHRPADELEKLTLRPRKGLYWLPDAELSPCQSLVQRYQQIAAEVGRQPAGSVNARARGVSDGSRGPGLLYQLFVGRGWLGRALAPDRWAVVCPWTDAHTAGTPGDTSCVLFAPRAGEELGWWHCSHAHCTGRDLRDVLAAFSPAELDRAREQAGLPPQRGRLRATGTIGGLRTVQAPHVPMWRTISAQEVKQWQ